MTGHFVFQDVCSEMPTVYIKSWSVVNPIDMATTVRFYDGMTFVFWLPL